MTSVKDLTEKTISSEVIYEGRILTLRKDKVKLPDDNTSFREVVEHPGAVGVVAINHKNEVLMVCQYRKPVEEMLWEIPAGKLDKNENSLVCAKRELEEETGYKANQWEKIFSFYSTPGFSNEKMHLYACRDLVEGHVHPDDDEFVEAQWFSYEVLMEKIQQGELRDGKTIVGLLAVKEKMAGSR